MNTATVTAFIASLLMLGGLALTPKNRGNDGARGWMFFWTVLLAGMGAYWQVTR